MAKEVKITEEQVIKTPAGGVLVGKDKEGQTIIPNDGSFGGFLVGRLHKDNGIKAVNKSNGQMIELQGNEVVITSPAVADQTKKEFQGRKMTNRQILSKINSDAGGVSFEDGGKISNSGKAKGKSLNDIAEMHKVAKEDLMKEVRIGMEVEKEHTSEEKEAMRIVKDHLFENPKYYTILKEVGLVDESLNGSLNARSEVESYPDILGVNGLGVMEDGGDLDFLDNIPEIYEGGGDTGKTKIFYVKVQKATGELSTINDYKFYNFKEFKATIEEIYLKTKFNWSWIRLYLYDEQDTIITDFSLNVSDSRNTTKTLNPITGKNINLEKIYLSKLPNTSRRLDFSQWLGEEDKTKTKKPAKKTTPEKTEEEKEREDKLPKVFFVKVDSVGGNGYYDLVNNRYDSFEVFKKGLKSQFEKQNKASASLALGFYDSDNKKIYQGYCDFSDRKNTVKNFNPLSGKPEDLYKQLERDKRYGFKSINLNEWLYGTPETSKTEEQKQSKAKKFDGTIFSLPDGLRELAISEFYIQIGQQPKENTEIVEIMWKDTPDGYDFWREIHHGNFQPYYDKYGKKEIDLKEKKVWIGKEFISNEIEEKIQKIAFNQGFKWFNGGTEIRRSNGFVTGYFFDLDKDLLETRLDRNFFDSQSQLKEVKLEDLLGYIPQKNKTQEEAPEVTRNFNAEKKYLTSRINSLSSELELKKPMLNNDEVAFYQREINKLVYKLRVVNNDELEVKIPVQVRINEVYSVQWGDYNKKYPKSDLKSINGVDSELTTDEYLRVRTAEFKSFFGDWEQAYLDDTYSGISKIINPKTKEPMPVFHGTNVLFTEWKTYETNNAHYFAIKREFADFFATTWETRGDKAGVDSKALKALNPNTGTFIYRCFLDIRNPIDFSKFGVEKRPIKEFLLFLKINYNIGDYDFWTNLKSTTGITAETQVYAWQIIRLWQNFTKYIKAFTTYDGYIFYEYIPSRAYGGLENASLAFCAFESNQVKFADASEFNSLSNDSRFELGGKL